MAFNTSKNYEILSYELASVLENTDKEMSFFHPTPLIINGELDLLIQLLPEKFQKALHPGVPLYKLRDIVLDLGRPPHAWFGPDRVPLDTNPHNVVTREQLDFVIDEIGGFGPDNRAGINGCLHRISAMTNLQGEIYGLTMRVGRSVTGNADMVMDLMMKTYEQEMMEVSNDMGNSILILGVPGTGKTTIIREMARKISQTLNVCVVDTSNEICGDGDVPHFSVGFSRRMMVPGIEAQSEVMIECLQNHTPDVIVLDEIGRRAEVEAARTVRQRGVRIIASAHGDLEGLVRNKQLNGLIGGVETVTLGDEAARRQNSSKLSAQRIGKPIFDVIVELYKGTLNQWRVVTKVETAVDCILKGNAYPTQIRTRDPETGTVRLELTRTELKKTFRDDF